MQTALRGSVLSVRSRQTRPAARSARLSATAVLSVPAPCCVSHRLEVSRLEKAVEAQRQSTRAVESAALLGAQASMLVHGREMGKLRELEALLDATIASARNACAENW
mmetsp:Transcript_17746/g.58056  ORF Transcript_17746/g.58056 Transcript_17746/m.58056 type:complete len:108 (-) Transcript_17746:399-722(-)